MLEAVLVGPLPGVLKMCLVLWFVVGCVEVITATCQTGVHNSQILIGQGKVYHKFRLVFVEECLQLLHVVSIHLSSLDVHLVTSLVNVIHDLIAFSLATAGNHKVRKYVSILCNLECCYRCDASGANH